MKLNNLAVHKKMAAVYATILVMLSSCQSDEKKLGQLEADIAGIEARIDSLALNNELTDSVSRNSTLQFMIRWIERDTHRIDSLRARNWALTDSINARRVTRASGKYPLSAFMKPGDLKIISDQLREYHSEWNKKYAENIIAGRGTLLDLYNTCFDLDYTAFEPPFYIANEMGSVRFNDARLNKYCEQFERERDSLENQEILSSLRRYANQKEFIENQVQIKEYERRCEISDSMYLDIARYFKPKLKKRSDSLMCVRDSLRNLHADLAQRIKSRKR